MILETTLLILTLIVLLIASYTDLKTREVPDYLSYSFLFTALGIRIIYALDHGFSYLLTGLLGFLFCFILSIILYYTHLCGGADSKLLMGLGVVIGIPYPLATQSLALLWFFLLLLAIGSFYGLIWMFTIAMQKKSSFLKEWQKTTAQFPKLPYLLLGVTVLLIPLALFISPLFWPLLFLFLPLYYLILFIKATEASCFHKNIPLSRVTLGDWITEPFTVGKLTIRNKTIQEEDLEQIRKLPTSLQHHTITIREGIPFVPSFLFAYLALTFSLHSFLFTFII